jgi:hypothetical protein
VIEQLVKAGEIQVDGCLDGKEAFLIHAAGGRTAVVGSDDSGTLYGCLELADRVGKEKKLPGDLRLCDSPRLSMRGTCIGMQKTQFLPGRKVYEYPYTPENFPFFYEKEQWRKYLDFLVENRFNALYLWNGHPFASLVRLKDYPYAVEVSDETFARNVEMYNYITTEADRRGIWVIQMFYNIFVSKPFAERHGIDTQHSEPTPLLEDYTRKSIGQFVRTYPNVGLLVTLGEEVNPVTGMHPVFVENPIVGQLPDQTYIAVFDGGPDWLDLPNMFGYSLSADGINWSKAVYFPIRSKVKRWWKTMRTPLGLIPEGDNVYTIMYTAWKPDGRSHPIAMVRVKLKPDVLQKQVDTLRSAEKCADALP